MGYLPSGAVKPTDTTTALNTKLPLEARLLPSQRPSVQEEAALPASRSSYFQKRGCVASVYGNSTGTYHGNPARTVASIKAHSDGPLPNPPSVQYSTTQGNLAQGYTSVSNNNFMSELRSKEIEANEQSMLAQTAPTRSSARKTLPSIRMQTVRKECAEIRPTYDYAKTEKRGATLSVKGVVERCPDVGMFIEPPVTTYQAEVLVGREKATTTKPYPGYQCHVPQTKLNMGKMVKDQAILDNKGNVLGSAPCRAMPGYGGHIPTSTYNDRGREGLKPTLSDTTAGLKAARVALDEFSERKMNTVTGAKSSAVRKFFTPGPYADHSISDQFYLRYRPLEGFMKSGPSSTTQWISDQDLRTNVL
jgi:hypothetical protein